MLSPVSAPGAARVEKYFPRDLPIGLQSPDWSLCMAEELSLPK